MISLAGERENHQRRGTDPRTRLTRAVFHKWSGRLSSDGICPLDVCRLASVLALLIIICILSSHRSFVPGLTR